MSAVRDLRPVDCRQSAMIDCVVRECFSADDFDVKVCEMNAEPAERLRCLRASQPTKLVCSATSAFILGTITVFDDDSLRPAWPACLTSGDDAVRCQESCMPAVAAAAAAAGYTVMRLVSQTEHSMQINYNTQYRQATDRTVTDDDDNQITRIV